MTIIRKLASSGALTLIAFGLMMLAGILPVLSVDSASDFHHNLWIISSPESGERLIEVSMNIALAIFISLLGDELANWSADWVWGFPLIVLTVVIHVIGLGLISERVDRVTGGGTIGRRHPTSAFALIMGVTTLLLTAMHAMEASIWAIAYRLLDAMRDNKSAMLYSLNAMTSYGHENLALEAHWKLMGAIEALNGWLLFGLTTAFLFGMIEKVKSSLVGGGHR